MVAFYKGLAEGDKGVFLPKRVIHIGTRCEEGFYEDARNKRGIKADKMNRTDLIRGIQRAEGNTYCFATINVDVCNELECSWRKDCLGKQEVKGRSR